MYNKYQKLLISMKQIVFFLPHVSVLFQTKLYRQKISGSYGQTTIKTIVMASRTCEVSIYFVFVTLKKTYFFLVDSLQYSINELMVATWNLSTELGCGGFVKVFLATDLRSTGTKVPVKVLSK